MDSRFVRVFAFAATAVLIAAAAAKAPAQIEAPWPVSFPAPTPSPSRAVTGTITGSQPFLAQMQASDGSSITLHLRAGTVILVPDLRGLAVGQRVYVHGFPQDDGSLRVVEIDVMPPLTTVTLEQPAGPSSKP